MFWRQTMQSQFSRSEMLFGSGSIERLAAYRIAIFGIGGVGGYVVEALSRSGIGTLDLIDDDRVALSNLNRQIIALHSTLGQRKVDVAEARCRDINPDIIINKFAVFYTPQTSSCFDFRNYDYVVDCIDTVTGKIQLILQAQQSGTPVISSMGAGNKMDPSLFRIADIYETSVDPLARVMRHELKKRGVPRLKVVYSTEPPLSVQLQEHYDDSLPDSESRPGNPKRCFPGSNAFVPASAGLLIASEIIKDLLLSSQR